MEVGVARDPTHGSFLFIIYDKDLLGISEQLGNYNSAGRTSIVYHS